MNELQAHIEAENAKTHAWVAEDPENRWAGKMVSDPAHWAEYEVYTIAQYEQYNLDASYSDLHKEVYGCRPHWGGTTVEDYDNLINCLHSQNEAEAQWERAAAESLAEEMAMLPNKYEQLAINAGYAA